MITVTMSLTRTINKPVIIIIGVIFLVLLAASPSVYFYNQYQKAKEQLAKNPLLTADNQKQVIENVSKLIAVPIDEEPTIATITDKEKLKDQVFFANAKNGDKVLIYNKAKKAILYDPIANKIVEVGPLVPLSPTVSPPSTTISTSLALSPSPSPTTADNLRVYLYNGTTVTGLTKKVEDLLKEKMPEAKVVDRDNAAKKDYAKTLVIDLKGNNKDDAQKLAKAVGGEISSLPAGETKPEGSDFLIIVGADKK